MKSLRPLKIFVAGFLGTAFSATISCAYGSIDTLSIIEGHVKDKNTLEPIPGIQVACDQGFPTTTGDDGYYFVEDEVSSTPDSGQEITCQFTDADGEENGSYQTTDAKVVYEGTAAALDVEMEPMD